MQNLPENICGEVSLIILIIYFPVIFVQQYSPVFLSNFSEKLFIGNRGNGGVPRTPKISKMKCFVTVVNDL